MARPVSGVSVFYYHILMLHDGMAESPCDLHSVLSSAEGTYEMHFLTKQSKENR